jgi:hypothetical protein
MTEYGSLSLPLLESPAFVTAGLLIPSRVYPASAKENGRFRGRFFVLLRDY